MSQKEEIYGRYGTSLIQVTVTFFIMYFFQRPRLVNLRYLTENVYGKAVKKCVMEKDWIGASRLWKARYEEGWM